MTFVIYDTVNDSEKLYTVPMMHNFSEETSASNDTNLLHDPYSLSSWNVISSGGQGWKDYNDDMFGTSYSWSKKSQTVGVPSDLIESISNGDDISLTVTEQYSKTYCGEKTGQYKNNPPYDRYYLEMSLLDDTGRALETKSTGILEMKDSCTWSRNWHTAELSFEGSEIPANIHSIKVEHGVISGEYWSGHYGPAMKGISLHWNLTN